MEKPDLRNIPYFQKNANVDVTDAHWRQGTAIPLPERKRRLGRGQVIRYSVLVPMKNDGVSLAADILLPRSVAESQGQIRVPTVFHQTRYTRSLRLRKPWRYLVMGGEPIDVVNSPAKRAFLVAGYAVVSVDVRGTGASEGIWEASWSDQERKDSGHMLDWIVQQHWSNGSVALYGISYDAAAALRTLSLCHPAVVACVALFPFWDVYRTISFPGGVPLRRFLTVWSQFNDCMDRNDFGGISRMAGAFVRGVTRADRLEQSTYGQSAVADGNAHRLRRKLRINSLKEILKVRGENPNYNAAKDLLGLGCCDDLSSYGPSTILDVSACKHVKDFQKASLHAPLLSVSGWLDTTAADAISSFAASEKVNPYSKLVIGPWNHGGLQQVRLAKGEKSTITAFDLIGEIMDFLETHLARRQPRLTLDEEPAVHYYCMGSGEWKASCSWPPIGQSGLRLYLAPGLLQRTTTQQENEVHYEVDFQLSPKGNTRWNAMLNYLAFVRYDDFGPGYLHFVSEPLDGDLEVTGSPILEITLRSSDQKADIFAYLLDLDPAIERSLYVTEGCFRCAHYRESDLVGESDDARLSSLLPQCPEAGIPPHSFRRKDFVEHLANEPTMVRFDLAPTSYKFRKGNRVALAIGGADHSEFSLETSPEPMPRRTLTFFLGGCHPSCLVLPVVRQA